MEVLPSLSYSPSGSRRSKGSQVFTRKDPTTNNVILSRRAELWDSFFKLTAQAGVPDDFMSYRQDSAPQKRELFCWQ